VSGQNATMAAGLVSPLIAGPEFSECDGAEGGVLRMELPLSQAEMVAALYDAAGVSCCDLATTGDLWREVAVTVACSGLGAVGDRAAELADPGNVAAPDWLRFCRERVAATLGQRSAGIGVAR
jgi:hypothetical protein